MREVRDPTGRTLRLGDPLGEGGEGTVYRVVGLRHSAAKIYHPALRTPARRRKVEAMIAAPPADPMASRGKVSLAWPQSLLLGPQGAFVGFTMPAVESSSSYALHQLWKAKQRPTGCTWGHMVRVASNLAAVFQALHNSGYVVGDVNESNFLVLDTALVVAVDLDSIQVPNPRGEAFLCEVHKPEFAPPELQHGFDFRRRPRTADHDRFGLAVLIWQLLMLGRHPFAAGKPHIASNIREGRSWAFDASTPPPAGAPARSVLPDDLWQLAESALTSSSDRPAAIEWQTALSALYERLLVCDEHPLHRYGPQLDECPWCAYRARWSYDAFDTNSAHRAYDRSRASNRSAAQQWAAEESARLAVARQRVPAADRPTLPGIPIPSTPLPTPVARIGPHDHMPPASLPGARVDDYRPRRIPRWWWAALFVAAIGLVAALLFLPVG